MQAGAGRASSQLSSQAGRHCRPLWWRCSPTPSPSRTHSSTHSPTMTRLTRERRRELPAYHSARPVRFFTWSRRAMEKRMGLVRSSSWPAGQGQSRQAGAGGRGRRQGQAAGAGARRKGAGCVHLGSGLQRQVKASGRSAAGTLSAVRKAQHGAARRSTACTARTHCPLEVWVEQQLLDVAVQPSQAALLLRQHRQHSSGRRQQAAGRGLVGCVVC